MKHKSKGAHNAWRRLDNSRYISRSIERTVHKLRVSKANPKRLFGCVGGPFDGCKLWLTGSDPVTVTTLTLRVGAFVGRYVWHSDNQTGSQRVAWEPQ